MSLMTLIFGESSPRIPPPPPMRPKIVSMEGGVPMYRSKEVRSIPSGPPAPPPAESNYCPHCGHKLKR